MVRAIGVIMIAVGRCRAGSNPAPLPMFLIGGVALLGNLASSALIARLRAIVRSPVQRLNDAAACLAVLAATGLVALTHTNLGDVVIGGVLATLYVASGWDLLRTGEVSL